MNEMPSNQTVPAASHLKMPWANGLGETLELVRYPRGSSMSEMEFRISVASLNQTGPFSRFTGIERTLMLLDSSDVVVKVDGTRKTLSQFEQLNFDGESQTELIAITTPSRDLNIMCRKGVWVSQVDAFRLGDEPATATEQGDFTAWIFVSGIAVDSTGQSLESLDMAISQEMPGWLGTGVAVRICLFSAPERQNQ